MFAELLSITIFFYLKIPSLFHKKKKLSNKDVNRLVSIGSSPEKIICRYEQVTEAEIIDALNRGLKVTSIDGIKKENKSRREFL